MMLIAVCVVSSHHLCHSYYYYKQRKVLCFGFVLLYRRAFAAERRFTEIGQTEVANGWMASRKRRKGTREKERQRMTSFGDSTE